MHNAKQPPDTEKRPHEAAVLKTLKTSEIAIATSTRLALFTAHLLLLTTPLKLRSSKASSQHAVPPCIRGGEGSLPEHDVKELLQTLTLHQTVDGRP